MILAQLASDGVLDAANDWLCRRRRDFPAHDDVWDLRRHWSREKDRVRTDLLTGRFRFGLLSKITLANGDDVGLWPARDALVLKAMAMVLAKHLPISPRCTHVKGHGGGKAAVARRYDLNAKLLFNWRRRYGVEDRFLPVEVSEAGPPPTPSQDGDTSESVPN